MRQFFALEDVTYILPVWQRQRQSLERLGRLAWAEAEFQRALDELAEDLATESWRRLPGLHRLGPREAAVARELAIWREKEAADRNRPVRRILRDDLIIELAVRQPRNARQLLATRDMNRTNQKRAIPAMLHAIERGLAVPDSQLPPRSVLRGLHDNHEEHALGKLLAIALADRCAEVNIARPLVGTTADLKRLVRWHVFGEQDGPPPRLTIGWRAEVCGDLLTDVLDGKVTLRVADPESEHPLVFERREPRGR